MKRTTLSPETVATKKAKEEVAEARRMQMEALTSASRTLSRRLGMSSEKPEKVLEVIEDKELSMSIIYIY